MHVRSVAFLLHKTVDKLARANYNIGWLARANYRSLEGIK